MATFNRTFSNSVAFAQSDASVSGKVVENEIVFEQRLCSNKELNRPYSNTITFIQAIARPSRDLLDPPVGFTLPVIFRRRLVSRIGFTQQVKSLGGRVYAANCYPPMLVPNSPTWETLSEAEWEALLDWEDL